MNKINSCYLNFIKDFKERYEYILPLNRAKRCINFKELIEDFESDCELFIKKWHPILFAINKMKAFSLSKTKDLEGLKCSEEAFKKNISLLFVNKFFLYSYKIEGEQHLHIVVTNSKKLDKHKINMKIDFSLDNKETITIYDTTETIPLYNYDMLNLVGINFYNTLELFFIK